MNDLFNQIRELAISKTAKDTYIVFAGNSLSFIFGIIFAVFAARAVEPTGWGIFSAAGALMVIFFSFSELGLSSGLFRFVSGLYSRDQKKKVNEVASVILAIRIITSTIFAFIVVIFSQGISKSVLKVDMPVLIYLTAIGLVGSLLIDFQISLLQAKRKWFKASFLLGFTNFVRLVSMLLLRTFWSFGLVELFCVFFLAPIVTFTISLVFERPTFRYSLNSFSLLKKVSKFSLWMGLNGSVGSISSKTDSILLVQLAGPFEAGIVGAARQLSNAVVILVGSFATVIATRLASYKGKHLQEYFNKTIMFSLILAVGVLLGIVFVDPVISLLGPKYSASSGVLKWLLVGLVPFALASPYVNSIIYAFHKPYIIAILSLIQLPLIILGNIIMIPRYGIFGPVIVLGVWNVTTLLFTGVKAKWELSHTH